LDHLGVEADLGGDLVIEARELQALVGGGNDKTAKHRLHRPCRQVVGNPTYRVGEVVLSYTEGDSLKFHFFSFAWRTSKPTP